ncbi:MAG: RNA polymerase sigma factor [Wenzhouxiangellaceae bacterium]|nr:RNA polymerase sigma factor [Wenzhouxiangellaceae bacterium]
MDKYEEMTPLRMNSAELDLLVLAAQDGDRGALETLVRATQRDLLRFAFAIARDRDLARDAVQDAWVAVAGNLRRLDDPRGFRPWVFRQVRWRVFDQLRRRSPTAGITAGDEPDDGGRQAGAQATDFDLARALGQLAAPEREVVGLFYLSGLSIAEIALVLDIPPGTVKSRLHRARGELKHQLQGDDDES